MSIIGKISSFGAALVLAVGLSTAAQAAVITINDGDVINPVNVNDFYLFNEDIVGSGGPGSRSFTFVADAVDAPLSVLAGAANLLLSPGATMTNATLSWFTGLGTNSISLTNFGFAMIGEITTLFTDPDTLTQTLTLSWDAYDAKQGAIQLSVAVQPVPLPAGGLLLLTAMGGIVLLRRRKSVDA